MFSSFIFTNEDVTVGGKKLNDDGSQQQDNQTAGGTGTDSQAGGAADAGSTGNDQSQGQGFGTPVTQDNTQTGNDPTAGAAESDNDSDYTSMTPDDDGGDNQNPPAGDSGNQAGGDQGADNGDYTQMQPDDQEQSAADDTGDSDYTQMQPDDQEQSAADDPQGGGTDQAGAANTGATPDPTTATPGTDATSTDANDPIAGAGEDQGDSDYTQMTPDDDGGGDSGVDQGASQAGPATGTPDPGAGGADAGNPGGGPDAGSGNDPAAGAAEEPDTDYGELSPDGDGADGGDASGDGSDNPDGDQNAEGDQGSEDGLEGDDSTADDSESKPTEDELKELEAQLFAGLSPEQIQIKDNELKIQFIRLYEDIERTENRVNRIVKTDANENVVNFISRKLEELKDLTNENVTSSYQTRSYMSNKMTYNHLLATFNSIGEMLKELAKRDKINDKKNKELDETDDESDMITTTKDDNETGM